MDYGWTMDINCQKEMWKTMGYDVKIITIKNSSLYLEKEMKLWIINNTIEN